MQLSPTLRKRAVLVDTSAFYARLDRDDQWHQRAVQGFTILAQEQRVLFTTNLVVAETYALARYRLGYALARDWFTALHAVNLVFQRQEHHTQTAALLEQYQALRLSYTDAFSFVVMEEMEINTAFAFDQDFQEYGWTPFPQVWG